MAMRPAIRPMTNEDKSAIMQILRAIPEFIPEEVIVAEEVIDCYLQDLSSSGYHAFVAEISSSVAGYICYGPTPLTKGTWDIYWVAVDIKSQGHGLGHALMAFAEDKIRENQGRLIIVETSGKPEYEKTRGFYSSLNYKMAGQIADFYAPGDDKLFFEKRLA